MGTSAGAEGNAVVEWYHGSLDTGMTVLERVELRLPQNLKSSPAVQSFALELLSH